MPMLKPSSPTPATPKPPRTPRAKPSVRLYTKDLVLIVSVAISAIIFNSISQIGISYALVVSLSIGLIGYILGIVATRSYRGVGFWKLGGLWVLVMGVGASLAWAIMTLSSTIQSNYMVNSSEQRRGYASDELNTIVSKLGLSTNGTIATGTISTGVATSGTISTGIVMSGATSGVILSTGTVIPMTGSLSGVSLSGSTTSVLSTGSLQKPANSTPTTPPVTTKPVTPSTTKPVKPVVSTKPLATIPELRKKSTNLTFYELVPALMRWYRIPTSTNKDITFTNISRTDPAYQYFKSAYYLRLVGRDLKVSSPVKCEVYMVMIGIINKRNITPTDAGTVADYRTYATNNNKLNGCSAGGYVTGKQL